MPRRKAAPPPKPPRRSPGTGTVTWVARRRRWRARLPQKKGTPDKESWHLTRDDAEAWIARELAREDGSFDPMQPVGEYLDYYLDLQEGRIGDQTLIRYRSEARALGKVVRAVRLISLRGDQVLAAQRAILKRGVTHRYAYNVLSLLNRALTAAVAWKIIPTNVMADHVLPEPEEHTTKAWSLAEARIVLTAIRGHRFEACYLLILWGGLRIGEVVALRWSDIDDDGTVAFAEAEHTHLKGRPISTTKRKRKRETQLPAHVVARLRELQADGPPPLPWPGRPKRSVAYVYVAQRPDGNRWTAHKIREDWKALIATLKIGDGHVQQLRPHGGRRTFGTAHMVAGTALADLATLMGHSSPSVTAQAYIASDKDRRKEAAERLARMLEPDAVDPNEGETRTEKGQ